MVDLGAGEPDFGTPEHVKDAAHAALNANFTKYTPSAGVLELRDAVAQRYRLDYGVEIKPEEVIITAGAKQALYNTAMVLFEPGDEVITHGPFWPSIVDQIKLADATPVIVQTHMEDGFAIKADADHRRDHAAHQGDHHQFAVQSDRRADFRSRDGGDCRRGGGARHLGDRRLHLREADLRAGRRTT